MSTPHLLGAIQLILPWFSCATELGKGLPNHDAAAVGEIATYQKVFCNP
jgi:hypothetical protein